MPARRAGKPHDCRGGLTSHQPTPILRGMTHSPALPRVGVLSIVRRDASFLLVRRAKAPDAGLWGFPGGKVEAGETLLDAAQRELLEETALTSHATTILPCFDSLHYAADGSLAFHYVIVPVRCAEPDGPIQQAHAGDDALEARWFSLEDISHLGARASKRLYSLSRRIIHDEAPDLLPTQTTAP